MAEILLIDDDREVLEINRKYLTGEEIGRASCRERV